MSEKNIYNFCPICNNIYIKMCNCNYKEKKCVNNHVWYIDKYNKIRIGNPHQF